MGNSQPKYDNNENSSLLYLTKNDIEELEIKIKAEYHRIYDPIMIIKFSDFINDIKTKTIITIEKMQQEYPYVNILALRLDNIITTKLSYNFTTKKIFIKDNIGVKIKKQNFDKLSIENINNAMKTIELIKKMQRLIDGENISIDEFKDVKFSIVDKVIVYFENDNIIFEPIV